MRKKSRILKSFLATASILGLSLTIPTNEIYAVAVSQMSGDVNLNDANTNFAPPFVNGNTIEVINPGTIAILDDGVYNIGAIRDGKDDTKILIGDDNLNLKAEITIGSMSGIIDELRIIRLRDETDIKVTLNGSAGVNNMPAANDYTALKSVAFQQFGGGDKADSIILNINAPVTLNSAFYTTASSEMINVNDNVIITNFTSANGSGNMNFNIAGDKSLTFSASDSFRDDTSSGRINFDFAGIDAVLNVDGADTTIRGSITNGVNGTLNVNAGITTATDPTITTIQETNIADNIAFNIDSINSNIDLLKNGANIVFKGADTELGLINTGNTDKQFTLYDNLNPSDVEDEYGVVRVEAATNALTIANDGGPYTIGQDNTHRLKEFEVKGAGNIVIDNKVFTKRFNMNSTGQVTLNQVLDLGAEGEVLYNQPGTLNVSGNNPIIGKVNFQNVDDTLKISIGSNQVFAANIDNINDADNNGSVIISQGGNEFAQSSIINSSIGMTNPIKELIINNSNEYSLNIILNGEIKASKIQVNRTYAGNPNMRMTINNDVNADIEGVSNGSNNFVLTINQDKTVTGAIDSINTRSTTINLRGSVTGPITNATTINFDGTGDTNLGSTANTTDFIVANAKANVTADGLMTGNLSYNAAGTVTATKGITGDADFKGKGGILNVSEGAKVTGTVKSTGGTSGILSFAGSLDITGAIGEEDAALERVEVGAGASSLGGDIYAGTVKLMADDSVLKLQDNAKVYGSVTTKTNEKGVLILGQNSSVAEIGAVGSSLERVEVGAVGAGASSRLGGNIYVGTVKLMANDSALTLEDNAVIHGSVTARYRNTGVLTLGQNSRVTKGIGVDGISLERVEVGAGASSLEGEIYAGVVSLTKEDSILTLEPNTTVHGSVTTANDMHGVLIFGHGNSVTDGIGAVDGKLERVEVGAGASNIGGNVYASTLSLTDDTTVLTLNPNTVVHGSVTTANDTRGVLILSQNSSVAGIGKNNFSLERVEVGAGASSLGGDIYAGAVQLQEETSVLTLEDNAKVYGSVITKNDKKGILMLGKDSSVTDGIGAVGSSLERVEIAAVGGASSLGGDIYVDSVLLRFPASVLILQDNSVIHGSVKTSYRTGGILVLGQNSSVTDGIGENGFSLERVEVGAGASSLGGDIYAGAVKLMADDSVLKLQDNAKVHGSVTTKTNEKGVLVLGQNSSVAEIGENGLALERVEVGAGASSLEGDIYAGTVKLTADDSVLTLQDNAKVYGSVTTKTNEKGVLIFGQNSSVAGIGANGLSLERVEVGAGASSLGGNIYAGTVKLTADDSVLTLQDNAKVHGSVTTKTNEKGVLILGQNSSVAGIGANGLSLERVEVGAGASSLGGDIYVGTVKLTADDSVLKLQDNAKVHGSVTTKTNEKGVLVLGQNSSVTDGIGANGLSLERVEVGAGGSSLGGDIYVGTVRLTADDSVLTLQNNAKVYGGVTTANDGRGKLIFANDGTVKDNVGENGKDLEEVVFKGVNTIEGTANAKTFIIANANAEVTVMGLMTGNVNYEADGTLAPEGITGNVDFKGTNGTFNVNAGFAIDGAVLSTGGVGGILSFKGDGDVRQNIGVDAKNSPALIIVQGDDTTNVSLVDNVFVGGINFTNGGKLQLSKNLAAKNIDFGAKGGTLELDGKGQYIFNAVIANGQTGVLNVLTTLTATDASVGTLKTINIGDANAGQNFLIEVNNGNLALLSSPNSSINFGNANSQLTLTAPVDQTVTFANSLKGGGIVFLNGNGHNLVIDGDKGVTLGSKGNELDALNIKGNVTITNNLDTHNINQLNIQKEAVFTDQSLTSAKIAEINIGELAGAATYSLDAVNGDFELNTGGMIFVHEDSALDLKNSSNANDHTITLTGPLDSGHDKSGIIKLTTGDKNLIIDNNGNDDNTLGTKNHRLKELDFVSTGNGTINLQAEIHVENIILDIHAITLKKVKANIRFEDDTIYTATGDIEGDVIDFQGKAGIINIADNIKIDSKVTSTGDMNGELNFEGAGEVTKLITNIKMLKAGSGNVSLSAGGDYSIGEIQGNGNNNLTFGANSRLTTTYINKTGGQAVNLIFNDGGSVRNAVGSNAAVGDIIVKAGEVNFGSTVKSGNIIVSNGAKIEVNDNITATDIAGENENDGTLKLNNKVPINITGTIGNNNSLGTIEVAGRDVTITGELKAQNILFSNAAQDATLTLGAAIQVTNITTAGNNIHTLVVTDFDTGNSVIGAEDHRLKAIELIGNGLITVNTKNFYSDVTTVNNGQGNVKLNIEGGTTYSLGSKNNSLASIQVSENSTIKGDVYSKEINIDAGKNIDFERGNNNRNAKNIIIRDVLVDRDLLPRSLQLFSYVTDIKADKLNFADAASSVHFKDAVLVNAEIDGGGDIKFDENVWLKEEIKNIGRLEFASEKFAVLEKNIKAANLVVNKANIVLLDNLGIDADSQFTDSVLDLANYELKHTGNVTYNGTLEIITYFDTTLQSGGHILVGNGANVDMSPLDKLVIKVKSRSDITKITPDTKHEVILKEAGGNFIPVAHAKTTVDTSGELNRLIRWVRWTSDENGVVLLNNNDDDGGGGNPGNPDPGDGDNGGGNPGNPNPGDGGGGLIPIFDPKPIKDEVTGPIAPGLIDQLIGIGIGNDSDAGKALNNLGSTKNVSETLNRLGGRTDVREVSEGFGEFNRGEIEDILTDISVNMDSFVSSGVNTRLDEVNNKDESTRTNQAAIAAGDEDNIGTGIWGVPFYGKATQKSRNDGASGYKSKSQGGIIGFDYALSDRVIVGAAYTRADSKLRHQDYKIGDRTKAISDIYSIYGLYNCETSNFFVEAIGSYGRSRIKNYEKRKVYTGDQTAIGKFNNTSYSGELLGGYNYLISNLMAITPMIGTRYATFKNNSYKETGTTFQNLSVRKKSYDRFEGIAGLKGITNFFVRDVKIKPELHGFVSYDFKGKLPNIEARLDGIDEPLTTVRFKPTKLNYNLGGGISTQYNRMEFGIRYNLSLAKKYIANQGSLRLKVNL
ncbi:MAG TPA: autotransporter domain-containing protein [Rickettsia endosymbiont of Omalisus fontisbellaquei]|nr:autotransporter domain-containing protein [Rickettsia endosymbiont of Omalisus fontisbellaquei]